MSNAVHHRDPVRAKLRQAWKRERRFFHARGVCHFLIWLLAMILTDLGVDWAFEAPRWARVLLLAVNLGILGVVGYLYWWRYLRKFDSTRVALEVERRYPELESLLVSYVQLGAASRPTGVSGLPRLAGAAEAGASPFLLAALRRQALAITNPLDFRQIVNFRELKRIFLAAACVFAFYSLLNVRWPDYFKTLALRMFGVSLPYPTRTKLTPLTEDLVVKQGDAVTLAVRADGLFPAEGRLYVRPVDGEWQKWTVKESRPNEFVYAVENVYEGFEYYMKIGDARTRPHVVRVVLPPRMVEAKLRVRYPAYTGRGEQELKTLSPEVLEGSQIEWSLRFATPVNALELLPQGAPPIAMTVDPTGLICRAKAVATNTLPYTLRTHEAAHGFVFDEGVEHVIRVAPDAPPDVELLQPLADEIGTLQKSVNITFRAVDDFGLAAACLVLVVNDGTELRVPIASFKGRAVEQFPWKAKDVVPKLAEGDTLSYALEVTDHYPGKDGPHRARSQVRRLTVVSFEEYQQHIAQQLAGVAEEVKKVYRAEVEASDQVKVLKAGD